MRQKLTRQSSDHARRSSFTPRTRPRVDIRDPRYRASVFEDERGGHERRRGSHAGPRAHRLRAPPRLPIQPWAAGKIAHRSSRAPRDVVTGSNSMSVVPRCAGAPTRSDRSTRRRRPSRDLYRWTESATTSCANHPRRSRARSGRSPPTSAPFERTSAPSPRSGWTSSTTTANESSRAGTASVTTLTSEITCRTPRRR